MVAVGLGITLPLLAVASNFPASSFSVPPLPAPPGAEPAIPAPESADAKAEMAPSLPAIPGAPDEAKKEADAAPQEKSASEVKKDSFGKPIEPPKDVLADLPPPLPESSEAPTPDLSKAPPPLPKLPTETADAATPPPALALPVPPVGDSASATPINGEVTALPEIKVEAAKPKEKTWKTTLAPSVVPLETSFHYKRELLPATIYRQEYTEPNQHLPKAMTRIDYENQLFESVVRNDVETTRALLNAGTFINVRASNGETPLAAARRAGAAATTQLLIARGGQ